MDIFKDSIGLDSTDTLEIDRFKAKILEIWSRMLTECYSHYYDEDDEDMLEAGEDYSDLLDLPFRFIEYHPSEQKTA